MLTVKNINRLIENHLKTNYHPKVFEKHFDYYLLVFEELLRLYSSDVGLRNKHGEIKSSRFDTKFGKLDKFDFVFHYKNYKKKFTRRMQTKFFNGYHQYDCVDINLLNVIKRDLVELGILVKTRRSQPISKKVFTPEQFTLNLMPGKQLFEEEDVAFEFRGLFENNSKSDFTFEINDLINLSRLRGMTPRKFLRNYFILMKMNHDGFRIKNHETNGRIHHALSSVSTEFRDIITPQNGNKMNNYDIKSSHPFWLAIIANSKALYDDIKNDNLYKKYTKKTIREWMNSKNFNSVKYKGLHELFFSKYGIDSAIYRSENGAMYEALATLESDYVQSISREMSFKNYTVHDQIYFDRKGDAQFHQLVKKKNRALQFEPIWVPK